MRPTAVALLLAAVTAACSDFPELDVPGLAAAEQAPYPALIPLTQALVTADSPARFTASDAAALQARAARIGTAPPASGAVTSEARLARLRARAAILRGPLGTEAEIEAMRQALAAL